MSPSDIIRLIVLAAIWGSSFLFMRILSPALGPVVGADVRLLISAAALAIYLALRGDRGVYAGRLGAFSLVGMVNSGVPFVLFSIAALSIPASYSAVLNALAPLFGALFLWRLEGEPLSARKIAGIGLGVIGVALMSRLGPVPMNPATIGAIGACVIATLCYGWAGVLIRRRARAIPSLHFAAGTQLAAGLWILPFALAHGLVSPPVDAASPIVIGSALAIGVLCSAVAYMLFFRLMADVGPTRTLTVTFIIPVFGILWAALFLGESITPAMLAGAALVIAGTVLVLR
ncbi:MAG: DMT family transporter [Burkholderiales bacterium]